jgi:hypothetical protein
MYFFSPGFFTSYWSAGFVRFPSEISPCFPLAGGLCKFNANTGGKHPIQHQPLLVQYKHQANPLLSMHNYTPLVIIWSDKNMKLTLLSQCKLALTAINKIVAL